MDLTVCTICGDDNGTSECHLVVFTVDVAFACHFVVPAHSSPTHPIRSSGIGHASKHYLKWRAIQLAIHSIVG